MKAWRVEDIGYRHAWSDDAHEYVIHVRADTRNEARAKAVGYGYIEEYVNTRAYRTPVFDEIEITPWTLSLHEGWRYECFWCDTLVDLDEPWSYDAAIDADRELEPTAGPDGEVFCCPACRDKWVYREFFSCPIAWQRGIRGSGEPDLMVNPWWGAEEDAAWCRRNEGVTNDW